MRWLVSTLLLLAACGKPVATCPDPPEVCIVTAPGMGCTYQYAACCNGAWTCATGDLSTFPGSCPINTASNFESCP